MQALSQLDLPHMAMDQLEFAANPFPHFEAARVKHPWLAKWALGHVVTEYRAMKELFIQDDKMRFCLDKQLEAIGFTDTIFARSALQSVMGSQAEKHRHLRETYAPAFTPRHANELRPVVRTTLERLLVDRSPSGEFDFHEFATWIPVSSICAILGVSADRMKEIKPDVDLLGLSASLSKELVPAIDAAALRLRAVISDLINHRRDHPPSPGQPDFLGTLVAAIGEGKLDDEQLVADLFAFITAGGTVTGMLTFIMRLLMDRPEIYRRCAEDAETCRQVVEEALRHTSTSTAVRLTTDDVLYRDVLIPSETILFFPFSISGRDSGTFIDGDTFNPDRPIDPERRHIAFGLGRHFCIGQYIARVEMQEALHLVAQRIRDPRLAGEYGWRPFPGIWGMKGLPITFTPA